MSSINIYRHSGVYTLIAEQILPVSMNEAWDFFSSPENLAKITPAGMGFKITSGKPGKMFAGQIITYKIGVIPFVKSNWVTEITQVENHSYFIDEQRFGHTACGTTNIILKNSKMDFV